MNQGVIYTVNSYKLNFPIHNAFLNYSVCFMHNIYVYKFKLPLFLIFISVFQVAKWHEMIGPRLESVERRNAFDIHAYGSRILNNFSPQRSSVSFNSVVRGQKPEEKSRYFLSMLMLANTENVEISTADGSDPQLG